MKFVRTLRILKNKAFIGIKGLLNIKKKTKINIKKKNILLKQKIKKSLKIDDNKKVKLHNKLRTIQKNLHSAQTINKQKSKLSITLNSKKSIELSQNIDPVTEKTVKDIKVKQKYKFVNPLKDKITYNRLKNLIVLEFIKTTRLEMGEKILKDNFNIKINKYIIGTRKNHVIYNMTIILLSLRMILKSLAIRVAYKKQALINYSAYKQKKQLKGNNNIQDYAKNNFIVTWDKWRGGVLTNFKRIAKRIISKIKNNATTGKRNNFRINYPKNIPQIPSLIISTTDNHWVLNESKILKIQSAQFLEISHNSYFGDNNTAINTTYFGLLGITALFQECVVVIRQSVKFMHHNKLMRRICKKSLNMYRPWKLKKIFGKKQV